MCKMIKGLIFGVSFFFSLSASAEIIGSGVTSTDAYSKEIIGSGVTTAEQSKEIIGSGKTAPEDVGTGKFGSELTFYGLPWYKVFMLLGY